MPKGTIAEKMLDLLSEEANVQEIVDEAARLLRNPIVVIDTRFHILYSSKTIEVDVELWRDTMIEEYVSEDIISDMERSQIISRLRDKGEVIEHSIPDNYRALRTPMYFHDKYCGFVGLYNYESPIQETDADNLCIVGKAVTAALYNSKNFYNSSENTYENLLRDLIGCDTLERTDWIGTKYPATSFDYSMRLLCVSRKGNAEEKKNLAAEHIKDVLERYLYKHVSIVCDDRLVLLFNIESMSEELWQRTIHAIEKYCKEYNLVCGSSVEFSEQNFIPFAYRQAMYSLEKAEQEGKHAVFYETYIIDSVLERCLKEYPAGFYVHPALYKIVRYDEEYHTEYLNTLKVYMNHFCSLKETAKELGVHYNTMKYRINMIDTIIEDTLKNNDVLKQQLFFSLWIYLYDKKEF